MQFLPRQPKPSKFQQLFKFLRYVFFTINRLGASLVLFLLALLLVFSYSRKSSTSVIGPPQAHMVQRLKENSKDEQRNCGCDHGDLCSTAVPVGSFYVLNEDESHVLGDSGMKRLQRKEKVREMMMQAWDAYVEFAWGSDELHPTTLKGSNIMGGMGATIVESLGTLYIMNLTSRYEVAREWVQSSLDFDTVTDFVSVYETTTRILGGLMSAYQLTGDDLFILKSEDLGKRLSHAFNSVNGIPYPSCHLGGQLKNDSELSEDAKAALQDGFNCYGDSTTQSEAGGLSLEMRALGFHSLDPDIRTLRCKADRAVQAVIEAGPELLEEFVLEEIEKPTYNSETKKEEKKEEDDNSYWSTASQYYSYLIQAWHTAAVAIGGGPNVDTTATFAKPARAFYEYIAKAWRQGGSCEPYLRYPLDAAMHVLLKRSIHETPKHDLYLRAFDQEDESDEILVDQSMCYLPAMFHLAAQQKKVSDRRIEQWHDVASGITKSCINMYDRFPGYLGGENARLNGGVWVTKGAYQLQADLVEAIFYMYRSTGEEKYQEIAWRILKNLDIQCKADRGGFTVLKEETDGSVGHGDRMPSEFLGSTLKFFYLTFSSDNVLPLNHYVFNRAGHPLLVTPALGAINNCHSDYFRR